MPVSSINNNSTIPWSKRHKRVTKSAQGGLEYGSLSNSFAEPLTMKELIDWCRESGDDELVDEYLNHSLRYTPNGGSHDLKTAIANLYGPKITPDNVLVFPGGQVALQTVHQTLCHKDMHAISFLPGYQSVVQGPQLAGAGEVTYLPRSASQNGWQLDLPQIIDATRDTTTYVVLNEPYNPAGTCMTRETQAQLVEWARKQNICVLCDEVYRFLEHDDDASTRLPAMADAYERGISVVTVSKPWGGCGITIGWVATQNTDLLDQLQNHQYFGTACVSRASEIQALMVLNHHDRIIQRNGSIIRTNKKLLQQFMDDFPEWFHWIPPTAGAIAAIRFWGPMTSAQLGDALAEEGIGMKPAYCFTSHDPVPAEHDYFRVGFGESSFPRSLEALRRFVEAHRSEWANQTSE